MTTHSIDALRDLEDARRALERVSGAIEAVALDDLGTMNVDLIAATSTVLGVADGIQVHRDRMAQLPEFDVTDVDNLTDYAKATWYLYVTNLPEAEPPDADAMIAEALALRSKLLLWLHPLVVAGYFEQAAYDKIKDGAGHKDAASDVVAAVGLLRSKWDQVRDVCAVTEADLQRGAVLGPAVFGILSRREHLATTKPPSTLLVRRAFTRLDRAYDQCRRALRFLRHEEGDANAIAPSLRRNVGPTRRGASEEADSVAQAPAPAAAPPSATAARRSSSSRSPWRTRA